MPSDTNVSLKIFERLRNRGHQNVASQTTALPVVIGPLVMVAKTAPNYVSQIPGALPLTELQKNNTHGHRTYSAKGTINVIFIFYFFIFSFFFYFLFYFCIYLFIYLFISLYISLIM